MDFTLEFIELFIYGIFLTAPLLFFFALLIMLGGQIVGRIEGWTRFDSFYWSFITAFTVGYGDIRPSKKHSQIMALLIALMGIMFTGIIVAITVSTASKAFNKHTEMNAHIERHTQAFAAT